MVGNGRVEVEFEYVPDLVEPAPSASDGQALGVLLELVCQAVHAAVPGCELRQLRFLAPMRPNVPRRICASVDRATLCFEVTSHSLDADGSGAATHLSGRIHPLGGLPPRFEPAQRAFDGVRIDAERLAEHFDVAGVVEEARRTFLQQVTVSEHAIHGALRVTDPLAGSYMLHPAVADCAWLLARLFCSRKGWPRIEPAAAAALQIFEPGAALTRISVVSDARASDGAPLTVSLVAESAHGVAALIRELQVRAPGQPVLPLPVPSPEPIVRGELLERLQALRERDRAGCLEQYLARLVGDAMGVAAGDIALDVPLRDLGLSSILASELAAKLGRALGRTVPNTVAFDHPTIARLSRALLERLAPGEGSRPRSKPQASTPSADPIAVVGIGCRLPGGVQGPAAFFELLRNEVETVALPTARRQRLMGRFAPLIGPMTEIDDIELFDARFFGVPDHEAVAMDPQQRILLETTWQALEHAGIVPSTLVDSRTGVFVGASVYGYAMLLRDYDAYTVLGNEPSAVAGRLSYVLGLRGPSMCVDTACSSSLVAISLACESLRRGETDLAIAGGINLILDQRVTHALRAAGVLSANGKLRAFDREADGYVRGEGCGIVLLRRLSEAERLGENVLGIVRGGAVTHGGRSNGLAAPNPEAHVELLRAAMAQAGVTPADVGYVEAHGTATPVGDAIELGALVEAYGSAPDRTTPLRIGSVKPNVGHLESAAGVVGFIKALLAVRQGEIPASINVSQPNEQIDWEGGGIELARSLTPWTGDGAPRLAAVSSFGMSGTYAHVILESRTEPTREPVAANDAPLLLTVSAKSAASGHALAAAYAVHLRTRGDSASLAATTTRHRQHMSHRAAVVGRTPAELAAGLDEIASGVRPLQRVLPGRPRVLFAFGDRNALHPGAGRELFEHEPVFRSAIEASDRVATATLRCSLVAALYGGSSDSALAEGPIADVACVAVQVALARLWRSWGVEPEGAVGDAAGAFAAAIMNGRMTLEAGLQAAAAGAPHAAPPHEPTALEDIHVVLAMGTQSVLQTEAGSLPAGVRLLASLASRGSERQQLLFALAELYALGLDPNWSALEALGAPHCVDAPTYPFDRKPYWVSLDHAAEELAAVASARAPVRGDPDSPAFTERLRHLPLADRWLELLERIKVELRAVMTVDCDEADLMRTFEELQVDSIGWIELRSRIEALTGVPIPDEAVELTSNADTLARYVLAHLGLTAPMQPALQPASASA